ncbi:MAG: T9SS type A sorting domain-containing protein, partial [Bacteroidota bacterium]
GTMGRADLDGSNPNPAFVPAADIAVFSGSMVIAGGFVYWATNSGVGRVGLDGSNPIVDFVSEATQVDGLATDGAALYISRGATFLTSIDRVDLDGSNFTELASGTGLGDAQGIAVAADASTSTAPDAVPGSAALTLALAPNPTSAATAITVEAAQTSAVQLAVYDLLGRHVTDLVDGTLAGGAPQTVSFDTAGLPTGVYLVRAQSSDGVEVKRLTVAR